MYVERKIGRLKVTKRWLEVTKNIRTGMGMKHVDVNQGWELKTGKPK